MDARILSNAQITPVRNRRVRLRAPLGAIAIGLALISGTAYPSGSVYAGTQEVDPESEQDLSGPIERDQSEVTADEDPGAIASPAPKAVSGSIGTYSRSSWEADWVDGPTDLSVITSTNEGTSALTGIVTDSSTGDPVAGAVVSLEPSAGGTTTTTTTGPDGGYAFVNIPGAPEGIRYDLTVAAQDYGSFLLTNDRYMPDETYQQTTALSSEVQVDDASEVTANAQQTTVGTTTVGYAASKRVPPTIRVRLDQLNADCSSASISSHVVTYPWAFYVLHVAANEIGTAWGQVAWKANFAAEQNYAWYFRDHPAGTQYDIGNSTAFQCFRASRKVPTKWRAWIGDPDQSGDPLENQLTDSNGNIKITEYRAGTYDCTESLYPQNGGKLSQNGSRARDDRNCGTQTWAAMFNYYYTGTLGAGNRPPAPNTSFTRPAGKVHLKFPAQVKAGSVTSNVGWRYQVDKCLPVGPSCEWVTIYNRGWRVKTRSVPVAFDYNPPSATSGEAITPTSCLKYRARAKNPSGWSSYASFNSGQLICPG